MSKTKQDSLTKVETKVSDRDFSLEVGQLAQQASGSVLARFGETVVLATVVAEDDPSEDMDFFPLFVDYEERFYASGKISGSRFYKREGKPSDEAVLMARMIDRPIRPLFPKGYRKEVQIIVTALSYDPRSELEVPSLVAASSALMMTQAPFEGPIGAVKLGYIEDEFVINPSKSQLADSQLDMVVAGTKDRVLMVEGEADEIPSEKLMEGFKLAHKELQKTIKPQEELIKKEGPETKEEFEDPFREIKKEIKKEVGSEIKELAQGKQDKEQVELDRIKDEMTGHFEGEFKKAQIEEAIDLIYRSELRKLIIEKDQRPDSRKPDEIRDLTIKLPEFPRAHGSALFQRGMTQSLSIITLASLSKEGLIDTMETESKRTFYHHYNFPPFCVGEAKPLRGPARREIGHSYLAQKALSPVMPSQEEFPYVTRAVSEILSSDGSSSMASVCSSSMALMSAGVPFKKSVSGIAIGLITETKDDKIANYKILTDIQGIEDFMGDMDMKLAGTKDGVTAFQLDVKVSGITFEIIGEALKKAESARNKIRKEMNKVIKTPRKEIPEHAPVIETFKIDSEKIGDVIGPGGKTINKIIDETDTEINIEEDGTVSVSSKEGKDNVAQASKMVKALGEDPKPGEIHEGKVVRVEDYGAFVEFLPGKQGLVHISEMAEGHVDKVEDVMKKGDVVPVMVIEIDDQGRVDLSYRSAKKKKQKKSKEDK